MILHGAKKKLLKDIVKYYVDTTGKAYEDFINTIMENRGVIVPNMPYDAWLAAKCFEMLKAKEISVEDCIENKDVIHSAIKADKSRLEGEFYTPEVWCKEGREYLKDMLGDLWGEAYIWDASCYDMDTELLTNRGWLHYDDLKENDLVYSLNPETLQGEYVGMTRKFKKPVSEKLLRIEGKTLDLFVTQDHSMFLKNRDRNGKKASYGFMKAIDAYTHLINSSSGGNCLYIPTSAHWSALDVDTVDSVKDAFWKLIGFYIGDGYGWKNASKEVNAIAFKLTKGRKIDYLHSLLDILHYDFKVLDYRNKGEEYIVRILDKDLISFISDYVGFGFDKKRVPFAQLPIEYTVSIIDGLVNSDGSPIVNSDSISLRYWSGNKELLNDVGILLTHLGYNVNYFEQIHTSESGYSSDVYSLYASEKVQHSIKNSNVSLVDYTGDVWDITLEKYHVFLVRRNGKTCFCGNCGSGNLLKTSGYPQDKIFLSTLLEEDVPLVKSIYPDATVFQCDFLKGIDSSFNADDRFSTNLPDKLVQVLKENKPLVFYMNPPYKVMKSTSTDVGCYMNAASVTQFLYEDVHELKTTSFTKCALDIFHQFMFRMLLLKRDYNLTNLYMGIFGPVTMLHSEMLDPLLRLIKQEFVFKGGMCFTAGDFSNTSESVGWVVGYTTWASRQPGEPKTQNIALTAKAADAEGNISILGERLMTRIDVNLHDWCKIFTINEPLKSKPAPVLTNIFSIAETSQNSGVFKYDTDYEEAYGYMMTSNYVIRGTRRCCVTTVPNTDSVPIVADNFWKCVGSYAARRVYATRVDAFNNCQYYNQPAVDVPGYNEWLVNALLILLFDFNAQECSYRPTNMPGFDFTKMNKLFPISVDAVKEVVTDERVKEDMLTHPAENSEILKVLDGVKGSFWTESKELYDWVINFIMQSYSDGRRAKFNYENCLEAWDAGLGQLRSVKGYFSKEEEETYSYLLNRLKAKLFDGVFKYGFMIDTAFRSEEETAKVSGAPVSEEGSVKNVEEE